MVNLNSGQGHKIKVSNDVTCVRREKERMKTMSSMYVIQFTTALRDVLAYTLSPVSSRLNLLAAAESANILCS